MGFYSLLTLSIMVGFMYLNQFATEVLQVPAAALATAMLIGKTIDFIVSLISAIVIEKAHLKHGKFVSWIRIATITCFFGIIAPFGDQAIAASAIIDRLVPVAFGVLFALSGAVGPILAQNWGAQRYDRMRRALTDSVGFAAAYVAVAGLLLALLRHQISALFGTGGETAELVAFFCLIAGPMWLFVGALFVANAAFNNLGMPFYSTLFSWGRATLGTVPLAWLGAQYAGPKGALAGAALGAVLFGIVALVTAYRGITRLEGAAQAVARSSLA